MSVQQNGVEFQIHVVGQSTGETFTGKFTAKQRLTKLDQLNQDSLYRRYLGQDLDPRFASPEAAFIARRLSEIAVRLVKYPDWWRAKNLGELVEDENLLNEIYSAAMKVEVDFLTELRDKAAKAQQVLRDNPGALGDGAES